MSFDVRTALSEAARRLAAGGVPDAARDARLLVAETLGIAPERLMLDPGAHLSPDARTRLEELLADRLRFRPMAQILGRRMFWGRWFAVTGDVLDPRPETETLVALALAGTPARRIIDLGTGSGAILLTLLAEWPGATGVGTDASPAALAVAARNAAALGLVDRAELRAADWWEGISEPFDLVVSNPPYISGDEFAMLAPDVKIWEPTLALTPGQTGLESYRRIASGLDARLAPGGRAFLEIGASQGREVAAIFAAAGFGKVMVHADLDRRDRVIEVLRN